MQELKLDHVSYFCWFASGCAGFLSLLVTAGGLLSSLDKRAIICEMADSRPPMDPPGLSFDLPRERILGSDHGSAFLVGHEERGYQLLGPNYYSTTRKLVPLVEIVKRTVDMMQSLAAELGLDLHRADIAIHYPNIFPDTWKMVTRYLPLPRVEHVMDEIAERAHCGATDSVISLKKWHRGRVGAFTLSSTMMLACISAFVFCENMQASDRDERVFRTEEQFLQGNRGTVQIRETFIAHFRARLGVMIGTVLREVAAFEKTTAPVKEELIHKLTCVESVLLLLFINMSLAGRLGLARDSGKL